MRENNDTICEITKNNPALVKKIDKMTYIVRIHFSKTSKETFNDKVKRLLCDEIRQFTT